MMQDKMLEELVSEVNRLNTIYNESVGTSVVPSLFELRAAEERLRNYLNERKVRK